MAAIPDSACSKIPGHHDALWIVVHLFGPVEGARHDSAMLRMSGLLSQLQNDLPPRSAAPGDVFAIYGDSAYPLRTNLQVPFT